MSRSDPAPPLADLTVDDLATRAQGGDEACFQELVSRLRGPLTSFIARRLQRPSDADDAVQETFLRAYRHLDRYDPARRFSTWLFAIGKNVASNHRAAERRRAELERRGAPGAASAADAIATPALVAEADEVWREARRVLGGDSYRALWLRYSQEMSVGEIAHELGRSVVATKVMLFRARRKLLQEGS
ncbi:MAG TPA: sigma-70 family RNA polymerase sigma factor [Kofleriaceae bacterium]|nr:sigma-70 family RNA polymerase sigma factor [Kofleriaceae bacterium]